MNPVIRWTFGLVIAGLVTIVPVARYRWVYNHYKRLRPVTAGVLYRSGELTASGFVDAVAQYGIRTIVNLQDEYPDPDLPWDSFGGGRIKESELCRQLHVRYLHNPPDLISPTLLPKQRPGAIDRFLAIMDDPSNFPVLIHCRAGLNRTGVMTAVYRMEYDGWTPRQAIEEMKDNGFGDYTCTSANLYITEYVLGYQPRVRAVARGQGTGVSKEKTVEGGRLGQGAEDGARTAALKGFE
jgi:protein-tyrosine phosphatase